MPRSRFLPALAFAAVVAVLLLAYAPTLQRIPNGSDHYYMIDVGETQVVLNVWGTLHMTGYPLYTMLGAALVAVFKAVGASPALAPALVSLLWGVVALALLYALAVHLTGKIIPAALMILLLGVTQTVWIHLVIAEVYSFGLALLALLLLLALWRSPVPGRIYWLALIGGLAVAHHRALAMAAPALVFAVWPELVRQKHALPRTLLICLLLGLIGFLPYAYLPLRAQAGAAWVYGEPGTWAGLWEQFTGVEAERFIGPPDSFEALRANVQLVNGVLETDLMLHGIIAGLVGLAFGVFDRRPSYRRAALTILISGLVAYLFHVAFYTDILSALILPVLVSIAFGWLFLMDRVIDRTRIAFPRFAPAGAVIVTLWAAMVAFLLYYYHLELIDGLTQNPVGLETIELAKETPPGSTLMIAWGVRHFAAGFARDVLGELPDIRLVDHKADYAALVDEGPLVTPDYTFYNQPPDWWEERLGGPVYLRAIAPSLVEIATAPEQGGDAPNRTLDSLEAAVECETDQIVLRVAWFSPHSPTEDLSVFVHLLDASGSVIAQADQFAPVYGWRPVTTWTPGEIVRDVYALPRHDEASMIRYGLYRQLDDGTFKNTVEHTVPVACAG